MECDFCGFIEGQNDDIIPSVEFYARYEANLCDRCVDKMDGSAPWSDKFANSLGLPDFPIKPMLKRIDGKTTVKEDLGEIIF